MNRFVKTALAIAAAGSVANAGTGDNDWSVLDSEISGLASSLKPTTDGSGWGAMIRAAYSHSSDDIATGGNDNTSGFNFNDVDLAFWGNQGPYVWRVSTDISDNEAGKSGAALELEDAWVRWDCGEWFNAQVGNMKPRVSFSNSTDPEKLLFIDRSALGSSCDMWDNGIGAMGNYEQLRWWAYVLNGNNGHERNHFYSLRGEWQLGSGAGDYEGAMGSSDTLNGSIGLTFVNDDTQGTVGNSDTDMWLLDFQGNVSNVGFGGEFAKLNDDFTKSTDEDFSNLATPLNFYGDSSPFSVYVSYLVNPEWEVAVRYEDLDNSDNGGAAGEDNTLLTIGANYYRGGAAGKWQAQWTMVDADSGFPDGDIFEVGFAVGSSR